MSEESEPKIIIDEDWKTQVEREKAEARQKESIGSESSDTAEGAASAGQGAAGASDGEPPLPAASFPFLVTSLASQAVMSMGQMPGPDGQPVPTHLGHAKHFIDTLGVLEEKTRGNLDNEEQQFLQETLHQIRMMFVAVSQQQGSTDGGE